MDEEIKKCGLKELNMTEAELDKAVEGVIAWLNLQPHLPHVINSAVIRSFIVGWRSVEIAKSKLEKYFMSRINFPAEIGNRDPMKLDLDRMQPIAVMPDLSPDGDLVVVINIPDLNKVEHFEFMLSVHYFSMAVELIMRERPYITQFILLCDLKHLSINTFTKISITTVNNAVYLFEHVYPLKVKKIIAFNTPQIADTIQRTIFKPLSNGAIYDSVINYTEDERVLSKHVPVEILPKDYGGLAPPITHIMKYWQKKMQDAKAMYSGECSLLPDRTKIPKQLADNCNFGTSGTFRKLDID